jgi:leucyl aminopeptidase
LAIALVACGPISETPAARTGGEDSGAAGSTGAGGAPPTVPDADGADADAAPPDPVDATPERAADGPSTVDASNPPRDANAPVDAPPFDGTTQDLVREMIGRFQTPELEAKYRQLESMSRPDRSTKSANYLAITEWVRTLLAAEAPAAVVRFDEQNGYRNVEISIKGTDPAAGIYMVGGHLDSVKGTVAMDDNGSGGLGTALIARALAQYRYKAEIRCVIFDAEEIGLVGSALYAKALKASGCMPETCLKIYINLDEIAYDPDSRARMRVWSDVAAIQMLHAQVNTDYMLGLTLLPAGGACHRSDDCSFSDQGYPTVYDFQGAGQSPYYHMPSDTADTLNYVTLTKELQTVAGVLATAAVPIGRAAP